MLYWRKIKLVKQPCKSNTFCIFPLFFNRKKKYNFIGFVVRRSSWELKSRFFLHLFSRGIYNINFTYSKLKSKNWNFELNSEKANKQTWKKPLWRSNVFLFEDGSVLKVQRRTRAVNCSGLTQNGFWKNWLSLSTSGNCRLSEALPSLVPLTLIFLCIFFYCDQQWVNADIYMDSNRNPNQSRWSLQDSCWCQWLCHVLS